jgi:hypothetical protein
MTTIAHPTKKGYRTIRFPLTESAYERCLTERSSAKARREELHEACADLFPDAFPGGSAFCGSTEPSSTPPLLGRRMRLEPGRPVFPSAPAFVMPARTGRTQDVDPARFWRRWPVPCGAMAHGLGREALSWERLEHGVGRCRLVGTTVHTPARFPTDLVAEATQSGWQGARVAIATSAAQACIVGASGAPAASQADVAKASGVLASDARPLDAQDAPHTVKTAGWHATARRLEGPRHPHPGHPGLAPCLSPHPCSGHHTMGRGVCAGPNAGVGGVSRPEPTGVFPTSAALAAMGRDRPPRGRDAEPSLGLVPHTRSGPYERCSPRGAAHQP